VHVIFATAFKMLPQYHITLQNGNQGKGASEVFANHEVKHSDKYVHRIVNYIVFWKFSIKLSNSGISLNWCITDESTTHNTTACFLSHSV